MFATLQNYLLSLQIEWGLIDPARKSVLLSLAKEIKKSQQTSDPIALNFICTHNSRRSHFASIWAILSLHFLGVKGIQSFSGGTERTAIHPNAVAALERAGLLVFYPGVGNPYHQFKYSEEHPAVVVFSKRFDDPPNPQSNFIAIMTCSEADAACPIVPGAIQRFSLPYEDPKVADGMPNAAAVYDERCRQIAREMLFLFSRFSEGE